MRFVAVALVLAMALPWESASAEPSKGDLAKTCLTLVQAKDFQDAVVQCQLAYDLLGERRLNGTLAIAADVALELRNAQVVHAQAISVQVLGDKADAADAYRFARMDATTVARSGVADATSKAFAQEILDRSAAALKAMGAAEVLLAPPLIPGQSAPGCESSARVTESQPTEYPADVKKLKLSPVCEPAGGGEFLYRAEFDPN